MNRDNDLEMEGQSNNDSKTRPLWRASAKSTRAEVDEKPFPYLLSILFVGLLGTVGGVLSLLRSAPAPYFLPVWVTQSVQRPIGLHGPLSSDQQAICSDDLFQNIERQAKQNPSSNTILTQLRAIKKRPASEPIIVYVSAFAGLDAKKKVFLVSGNSTASDSSDRLYLSTILQSLKESASTQKLLVLDIGWPVGRSADGVFGDDLAGYVAQVLKGHSDKNLVCLNSCSPGQLNWTMLNPRRSTFGYFFERGLQGEADGYVNNQTDGRVSLLELCNYITNRVDDYSIRACPERQTPMMIGDPFDFDLAAYSLHRIDHASDASVLQYPTWLLVAWEWRDQWIDQELWRTSPAFIREVENAILQTEMNWRRGENAIQLSTALEASLKSLVDHFNAGANKLHASGMQNKRLVVTAPDLVAIASTVPATTQSISESNSGVAPVANESDPVSATVDSAHPEETEVAADSPETIPVKAESFALEAMKDFVLEWDSQEKVTPPADWPALEAKLLLAFESKCQRVNDDTLVEATFHFVAHSLLPKSQHVIGLVASLNTRNISPIDVKAALLNQLARSLKAKSWEPAQLDEAAYLRRGQKVLQLVGFSERPLPTPEVWLWLAGQRAQADDHRYVIETLFWTPGYVSDSEFEQRLSVAHQSFANLIALERRLDGCFAALDLATWRIPQLSVYSEWSLFATQPRKRKTLDRAIELSAELATLLEDESPHVDSDSAVATQRIEHASVVALELQTALNDLLQSYGTQHIEEMAFEAEEPIAGKLNLAALEQCLASPFCQLDSRIQLHRAAIHLAKRQHEAAIMAYSRPSNYLLSHRLSTVDQARTVAQAASRSQTQKSLALQLQRYPELFFGFDEQRFANKTRLSQEHWAHLANLYIKMAQVSPIAESYQGVAQHYRNLSGESRDEAFRWESISNDLNLSPQNKTSQVEIPFYAKDESSPYSVVGYEMNSGQKQKYKDHMQVQVLPSPDSKLQATYNLQANQVALDLHWNGGLASSDESSRPPTVKGLFVEVTNNGRSYLHRLDLPKLEQRKTIELLVGPSLQDAFPRDTIRIRPSGKPEAVGLYLRNPDTQSKSLRVVINHLESEIVLAPLATQQVIVPGKAPALDLPLPVIDDGLNIEVFDTVDQRLVLKQQLKLQAASPREYVEVLGAKFIPFDGGRNRLEITCVSTDRSRQLDCEVALRLDPAKIPGLMGVQGGRLSGTLPADGTPLTLYAENLKLAETTSELGLFEISVDGVERTFAFETFFGRQGSPTVPHLVTQPGIAIVANETGLAGPGFQVELQTLNAPTASELQLDLRPLGSESKSDLRFHFKSPRQARFGFAPDGRGQLLVSANLSDWRIDLNTAGLVGRRQLQSQLFLEGKRIGESEKSVALDDKPPRYVRFQDLPQRVAAQRPLEVHVKAVSETTGVHQVQFFLGRPEDNSLPPKTELFTCKQSQEWADVWTGMWHAPKDPGRVELTIVAKNGAGLVTFETQPLEIVSADQLDFGSIVGQVFEGVRPQPGLEVQLLDQQLRSVAKSQTQFDGRFQFPSVRSGNYIIRSIKPATQRTGAAKINVAAGQQTTGDISLQLR